MKTEKKIRQFFDTVSVPEAQRVLPRGAFVCQKRTFPLRRAVLIALCLVFASVLAVAMLPAADRGEAPSYSDSSTESAVLESDNPSDIESKPTHTSDTESKPEDIYVPPYSQDESSVSSDVIIGDREAIYGAEETGECIADMYRPEGYHERIGSVLALMMELTPEKDARFAVLVSIRIEYDLDGDNTFDAEMEEIVSQVNETLDNKIAGMVDRAEVTGGANIAKYFFSLTAEQINAFAEYGARCLYIGSGIGDPKNMNWETAEGIKTYCEIWGDMYTFGNPPGYSILEHPDIETGPDQGGGPEMYERRYPDELYNTAPLFELVGADAVQSFFETFYQGLDADEIDQMPDLYRAVHGLGIAKEDLLCIAADTGCYTSAQIELIYTGTKEEIQQQLKSSWAFWYDGRLYNIYDLIQSEQLTDMFLYGELSAFLQDFRSEIQGKTHVSHFNEWIDLILAQAP